MNALARSLNQSIESIMSREDIDSVISNSNFFALLSSAGQSQILNLSPQLILRDESLRSIGHVENYFVLVLKGQIESLDIGHRIGKYQNINAHETFYYQTKLSKKFKAVQDSLILEIPMDLKFFQTVIDATNAVSDFNIMSLLQIRPAMAKAFQDAALSADIFKRVADLEAEQKIQSTEVEKGKKLFLEPDCLYFLNSGLVRNLANNKLHKLGDFLAHSESANLVADKTSRIIEYKLNRHLISQIHSLEVSESPKLVEQTVEALEPNLLNSRKVSPAIDKMLLPYKQRFPIYNRRKENTLLSRKNEMNFYIEDSLSVLCHFFKVKRRRFAVSSAVTQFSAQMLIDSLEAHGFMARLRPVTKKLNLSDHCVGISLSAGRIVFLLQQDSPFIICCEQSVGLFAITEKALRHVDWILEVQVSPFEILKIENSKSILEKAEQYGNKFIAGFFKKNFYIVPHLFVFKLFQTVMVLLIPTAIYGYLNQSVVENTSSAVFSLMLTMIVFATFQAFSILGFNVYSAAAVIDWRRNISTFFHRISLMSSPVQQKLGFIQTRISLAEFGFSALKYTRTELPVYFGLLVFYLIYIGRIAIEASAALLLLFVSCTALVYWMRKKGGFSEINTTQVKQDLFEYYLETVRSLDSISLLKKNRVFVNRLNQQVEQVQVGTTEYSLGLSFLGILGSGIFKVGVLLILFMVVTELIQSKLTAMQIFGVSLYLSYLNSPFQAISNYMTNFNTTGILGLPIQFLRTENNDLGKQSEVPHFTEEILVQKISARPGDRAVFSLQDLNFKIKNGQRIAILGKSGSGKTTLIKVLSHVVDYQQGQILIDQTYSKLCDKYALMNYFSYCPQIPELGEKSLVEQISVISARYTFEQFKTCWNAIFPQTLQVQNSLNELTALANTFGQSKLNLKRLQLVNYFLQKIDQTHGILIFDEPTQLMDSIEESHFFRYLNTSWSKWTILISGSRVSTARWSDRTIVLNNGRIAEDDEFIKLINQHGEFSELYRNQVGEQ